MMYFEEPFWFIFKSLIKGQYHFHHFVQKHISHLANHYLIWYTCTYIYSIIAPTGTKQH